MIKRSESQKALVPALIEWQKNMPSIIKDAKNPHFGNKFASLGTLVHNSAPVLAEYGLVVTQFPSVGTDDTPTLVTTLWHVSGEWIEAEMALVMAKSDPQGQGSALTYARRYAYCAVLGIVADEDDDAERAVNRKSAPVVSITDAYDEVNGELIPKMEVMQSERTGPQSSAPTPKQVNYAKALLLGAGLDSDDKLYAWFGVNELGAWPGSVRNLTKEQATGVIERLKP